MHILEIIKRYRKLILIAFSLVVIEDVAWILEPYVFGKVIDAVIDVQVLKTGNDSLEYYNQGGGIVPPNHTSKEKTSIFDSISIKFNDPNSESYLFPLIIWIAIFGINSGVGALRRSVDPKIFLNIYTKIVIEISRISVKKRISLSKTTARVDLSQQFIGFLQFRVPELIENTISISGAIIALYFFDWLISLTCLCIVLPLYIASRIYNKKVMLLQKEYHDKYEDIVDVFQKKDPVIVRDYFTELAKPQKKIANWGALNFGIMRVTLLVIFIVVLFVAIELDDFSAGELYSIVAYLWTFVTATEYLPELLENWTSMKDISKRIKTEG